MTDEKGEVLLPYTDIKTNAMVDLPTTLSSTQEWYADNLVMYPHLGPIAAYEKAYKTTRISAAKNFRRVYDRKDFRQYIRIMKNAVAEYIGLNTEQILHILALKATAKLTNIVEWDEHGNIKYKPSCELSEGEQLALTKFEVNEVPVTNKDGDVQFDKRNNVICARRIKVELKGADKAIELLGKHLGLWENPDDNNDKKEVLLNRFMEMIHGKPSAEQ